MASSSASGGSGDSGGGRRYPHNLEGLLRFSTEHTVTEATASSTNLTNIDPESIHPIHPSHGNPPQCVGTAASTSNDPKLARINQDRALEVLGLHRYRVPGDGNCLFRAVAWHLKLEQEKYHPMLRKSAVRWMRANKDQLLEWGLLDGEKEIDETENLGVWPGQAAIVALANIFNFNIAVIQGGDKGDIDIQHICPFATAAQAEEEQRSVILAYLYNGHYDAIVEEPNLENPEFEAWITRRNQECEADEALARKLATEECYNGSTAPPSHRSPSPPPAVISDQIQQHVSEVYVSSHTQPLHDGSMSNREPPLVVHSSESTPRTPTSKLVPQVASKPSRPTLPPTSTTTVTMKVSDKPHRPPPRKSVSEDEYHRNDENRMRITLYPKKQLSMDDELLEPKRHLYKPALKVEENQLRVNRSCADTNVLQERRLRDMNSTPSQRPCPPSIRITPLLYAGQQSPHHVSNVVVGGGNVQPGREFERKPAIRRGREYAERGPDHIWSQTSENYQNSLGHRGDRPERALHHQRPTNTILRQHSVYHPLPIPRATYSLHQNSDESPTSYSYDRSASTSTIPRAGGLPRQTASPVVCEVPVVGLNTRSPVFSQGSHHSHAHAIPAPVMYDLYEPFSRPPQLKPYRPSGLNKQQMDRMLTRNFML